MRLINIGSGSSGNSTYIGSENTHILVDAGISRNRTRDALNFAGLDLSDISAILITHEHSDHIKSLGAITKGLNIPIYATEGTIEKLKINSALRGIDFGLFEEIDTDGTFSIGDIRICAVPIKHDAAQPVCFGFKCGNKSAAIITDLGTFDDSLVSNFKNTDLLMVEANHDIRMLEAGPYPYPLKRRISGDLGHLSNEASGDLISSLLHDNIKKIVLAHLSKKNNYSELAKLTVEQRIDAGENNYKAGDFEVITASQDVRTKLEI